METNNNQIQAVPNSINLTVNDPINATIQEVAKQVVAVCEVLKTPEGQKSLASQTSNQNEFRAALANFGVWLTTLFRRV